MGVAAKAPSDTASRERFDLTQVVLGIDLCRSAVPTHSSPAVVSTEPALGSQLHEVQHEIQNIRVLPRNQPTQIGRSCLSCRFRVTRSFQCVKTTQIGLRNGQRHPSRLRLSCY